MARSSLVWVSAVFLTLFPACELLTWPIFLASPAPPFFLPQAISSSIASSSQRLLMPILLPSLAAFSL